MTEVAREIVRLASLSHGYELAACCKLIFSIVGTNFAPRPIELCLCRRQPAAGGGGGDDEPEAELAAADAAFRLAIRLPTDKDAALQSPPLAQFLTEIEAAVMETPLPTHGALLLELRSVPVPVRGARTADAAGPPLLRVRVDRQGVQHVHQFRLRVWDAAWDILELLRTEVEPGPGAVP
jgi:hypothetical protein